jgi:hypothetical protein
MQKDRGEATAQNALPTLPNRAEERRWSTGQKWRLGIGLAVGTLLLFCDWTDYSLAGTWPDYILPLVGIVAGVMALRASKYVPHAAIRRSAKLGALVTIVEASAVVVVVAVMAAMSPMGMMLVGFTVIDEGNVTAVLSPDGSKVAEAYYIGSDGMLVVRVKHRWMPLLERELYRGGSITSEPVTWKDNDTLFIPITDDTRLQMKVGLVRAELAPPVQLGITAVGLVGVLEDTRKYIEEQEKLDEEMSRPLKDIPIYPGGTEEDESGANMNSGGGFRAFDIKAPDSDEAAKWYKQALSEGEWTIVSTKRRETRAETAVSDGPVRLVRNCIEALRKAADGTSKHYYWRIRWDEYSKNVRVIVETPDPPAVRDCDES